MSATKKKRLFSELFAFIISFLGIKPLTLVNAKGANDVNTIGSWKTRGSPQRNEDLEKLISAINSIIEEKNFSFGIALYPLNEWNQKIKCILSDFKIENIDDIITDINKEPNLKYSIAMLLRYAYKNRLIHYFEEQDKQEELVKQQDKYKKLVVFDLDGTLIKGIKYSWVLLYQSVGLSPELCKTGMKQFVNGEISYPEWCQRDLQELQRGGLTLNIAQNATKKNCSLTKNFDSAINKLKQNGCAIGIISGGADIVLNSLIPNARELFDDNIFINKLIFDSDGKLINIDPTPYDWDDKGKIRGVQGKSAGLLKLCDKYKIPHEHSIFVGDDDNDFEAMKLAGKKIFYHSHDPNDKIPGTGSRQLPEGLIIIVNDDLMEVANSILETDNNILFFT